ncbi:hypothetical protein ACHAWF_011781 [Thalassiosira exigua]
MGFEPQLARIARSFSRTSSKQSVLCSATFPAGVQRLAADFLDTNYYFVSAGKVGSTHASIGQRFEWVDVHRGNERNGKNPKVDAVVRNAQRFWSNPTKNQSSVIVFTNTKDGAELYGRALSNKLGNKKRVRVIHGDKAQSERNRSIEDFKDGKVDCLVATDVAARGLDVHHIGLVIQADTPRNVDTHTHRIGRTGRAGRSGQAVTLLDQKSGFGIASGLVDLLTDAGLNDDIPSWLQGMAHIANARSLEEEMKIQAGSGIQSDSSSGLAASSVTNEEFSEQDFRRTAAKDSYGKGKDTSHRNFDDLAYSDNLIIDEAEIGESTTPSIDGSLANLLDEVETFETEVESVQTSPFERKECSQALQSALLQISGSASVDDVPDKSIMNSLPRFGQKLRFEYLGLYPFHVISPLLMTSQSNDSSDGKVKLLMVAEKPSIAKSIADALSGRRGPFQRRGVSRALPVYEFTATLPKRIDGDGGKCLVRVTSVVGHVLSLGFDEQNSKERNDPRDYFRLPVTKKEESTTSKLRVVDHLKALAGDSDHLVLWLDCDPEGENIAHEVMAVTRMAIQTGSSTDGPDRIHRAKFSAITPKAIQDAFHTLVEPDPDLSRSVDARQELDLRIGVALTRLLTWRCVGLARKRFSPSTRVISYGPCQTPALSFCFDRLREIEQFESTAYWKVNIEVTDGSKNKFPLKWQVSEDDGVRDTRSKYGAGENIESATIRQNLAKSLGERAKDSYVTVKALSSSSETIKPPVGLNTVALLEAGSKAMGMSPKQVMNVAEKLYSSGLISYPRTETTRYDPNGFDARAMLREHSNHPDWGRSATYLLRGRKSSQPPLRGQDKGDHPPITPLKSATRDEVGGGAAWRLYEFIVRHFIGSLHNELLFTLTTASMELPNSSAAEFELQLVTVDSLGFADVCRWVLRDIGATSGDKNNAAALQEGQRLQISKATIEKKSTRPPCFLQEHELIRLMDSNRIGTDASMAVHVSNIVDRGYVMLCDETGEPLRPPRPPGKRNKNLPRQIGRYMVPTPLGSSLLDLFDHEATANDYDSPAKLSHPSIRRQMEEEVKQIALGRIEKDFCIEKNLDWFEERYDELEGSLTRDRVGQFGSTLRSPRDYLRYLQSLGSFEPRVTVTNKQQPRKRSVTNKQQPKKRASTTRHKGGQQHKERRRTRVTQ